LPLLMYRTPPSTLPARVTDDCAWAAHAIVPIASTQGRQRFVFIWLIRLCCLSVLKRQESCLLLCGGASQTWRVQQRPDKRYDMSKRWLEKLGNAARGLCIVFADVRFVLPKWADSD
jgi:hypothetical protein